MTQSMERTERVKTLCLDSKGPVPPTQVNQQELYRNRSNSQQIRDYFGGEADNADDPDPLEQTADFDQNQPVDGNLMAQLENMEDGDTVVLPAEEDKISMLEPVGVIEKTECEISPVNQEQEEINPSQE